MRAAFAKRRVQEFIHRRGAENAEVRREDFEISSAVLCALCPSAVKDLRHAHRHGGLAGARVAGEAHVQRRRLRGQAQVGAQLVDHQQRGDVADALFHRRQTDQVTLQFVDDFGDLALGQHLVDGAGAAQLAHIDAGNRLQGRSHGRVRQAP